jgi:hypothetical protein
MKTCVILASGPSATPAIANYIRGKAKVIAVSDAWRLAPWADALVSQDFKWWKVHSQDVQAFRGQKFCGPAREMEHGVHRVDAGGVITTGTNSSLLACHVAVTFFGAEKVLLCGVDMHAEKGDHFFGSHPAPLKNTTPVRFEIMLDQFARWKPRGVKVLNCTPGSRLTCYPMHDLCDALT